MKNSERSLRTVMRLAAAVAVTLALVVSALAQSSSSAAQAKYQIDQAKIQIEQLKLQQAEYRAQRNEAAARSKDPEIKRYMDQITLKTQEMAMYQQQETLEKTPLSSNPAVAAAQQQIRQWTLEKARIGIQQTAANQSGNKAQAAQCAQQMATIQLKITSKTQEIRLLELKAKTQ